MYKINLNYSWYKIFNCYLEIPIFINNLIKISESLFIQKTTRYKSNWDLSDTSNKVNSSNGSGDKINKDEKSKFLKKKNWSRRAKSKNLVKAKKS